MAKSRSGVRNRRPRKFTHSEQRRGGFARARKLSKARRRAIARLGARARWGSRR